MDTKKHGNGAEWTSKIITVQAFNPHLLFKELYPVDNIDFGFLFIQYDSVILKLTALYVKSYNIM